MRFRFVLLILLLFPFGCVPTISKSELGTVEYELPKVSGAEKPYPMPQLGPPLKDEERSQRRFPAGM